ncbi:MAG TPA: hypothetical protein VME68_19260 [Acidobacteriaceae bacterium]|nr:hypothetical protein [Acidobacteriaceae bacterium]
MTPAEMNFTAPTADDERTAERIRNLADAEALRWREMPTFSRAHNRSLLDRLRSVVDAWLRRF